MHPSHIQQLLPNGNIRHCLRKDELLLPLAFADWTPNTRKPAGKSTRKSRGKALKEKRLIKLNRVTNCKGIKVALLGKLRIPWDNNKMLHEGRGRDQLAKLKSFYCYV